MAASWLSICVLLCSLLTASAAQLKNLGCYKEINVRPRPSHVVNKLPHEYIRPWTLPKNFDWRLVNGTCFVSAVTNQFQPSACGSCWAHASTGALTDRIIIAQKAQTPFVQLSPQVLLDCATVAGSCSGGSDLYAYKYIHEYGITDVTCLPYRGVDESNWGETPCDERMCKNCDRFGNCKFVNGTKYFVQEYGFVAGEAQMMAEIFARGPISCCVYAHSPAFENYKEGIIKDPTNYTTITHVVAITGWGVADDGTKYWVGRNSFGTSWGEEGWFKLERGTNCLDIENTPCAWAVPKL